MTPQATITLEIDGMRPMEVERLRAMIHRLIVQGILTINSGTMTLHFNDQGDLATIEVMKRWRLTDQKKVDTGLATPRGVR